MEDALILNFIRLVRNGRGFVMEREVFRWGDLHMMDNGMYKKDEEDLLKHRYRRGPSSPVFLLVSVKGAVAEIWKFQDFRSTNSKVANSAMILSSPAFNGVMLTEQHNASLKTLVSVIYAYLRIHELFMDIMDADPDDVSVQLVLENEELPGLEPDSCTKQVWAIEGLVGVNVTYNRLWRTFLKNKAVPVKTSNAIQSTLGQGKMESMAEQNVGSALAQGSDFTGSGRSMPTPHFAPTSVLSHVGSGPVGISQKVVRSPVFGIPEVLLPHAATCIPSTHHPFFTSPSFGAAAAAVAAHGTRTPAVRGYSFLSVPTFAALGIDSTSGEENDMSNAEDQLHELLEICDTISIQETSVELMDVLHILEKKSLFS